MAEIKKGTLPEDVRQQEFQVGPDRSFGILFTVVFGIIAIKPAVLMVPPRLLVGLTNWIGITQITPPVVDDLLNLLGISATTLRIGLAGIAALFLVLAFVAPKVLHPLNVAWMRLGFAMGMVVSPIVLGILFFLTVTPMGFVLRLMGKDLLRLKLDKSASSYWIERSPPGPAPDTMRNQF